MTPGSRSPVTAGARSVFTAEGLDWYASLPAAPAARLGDLLVVSGQVPLDEGMNIVPPGDLVAQTRYVFESIARLLEAAGATFDDVVDVIAFTQDPRQIGTVLDVARAYFDRDYPAWSIASFLGSTCPVSLSAFRRSRISGRAGKSASRRTRCGGGGRARCPAAAGRAIVLFVSAQSAIDPDGNVLFPGDHSAQARSSYEGILEIVGMAGSSVDDILDFTSFHQDLRGAEATFTDIYMPEVLKGELSDERAPSTSHAGTPGLESRNSARSAPSPSLPRDADGVHPGVELVEERAAARRRCQEGERQARDRRGRGRLRRRPEHRRAGRTAGQVQYILTEIREVLEGFGGSLDNVLGVVSFHKDPRAWQDAMQVAEVFPTGGGPAWTAVAMPALWMEGYLHEIAAIAVL